MDNKQISMPTDLSMGRFITGVVIFVVGQASTLLIPLVTASDLSAPWKATLSGTFFFITPQIGIVLAVAILGKAGWKYLMKILLRWLKRYEPPETVSPLRYRIGIIMFIIPLLFAWIEPYCERLILKFVSNRLIIAITGDVLFIASFFVLGGEFWDKIRALFIRKARAEFPGRKI